MNRFKFETSNFKDPKKAMRGEWYLHLTFPKKKASNSAKTPGNLPIYNDHVIYLTQVTRQRKMH